MTNDVFKKKSPGKAFLTWFQYICMTYKGGHWGAQEDGMQLTIPLQAMGKYNTYAIKVCALALLTNSS